MYARLIDEGAGHTFRHAGVRPRMHDPNDGPGTRGNSGDDPGMHYEYRPGSDRHGRGMHSFRSGLPGIVALGPWIVAGHGTNKVVEHLRAQHMAEAIRIHALGQQGANQKRGGMYHLRFCFLELTILHIHKKSAVSRTSLSTAM